MHALHDFGACGTWTRGYRFSSEAGDGAPEIELPIRWSLQPLPVVQFARERLRGWTETDDCPPRSAGDVWDVQRNARLEKRQPGGERRLRVESLGRPGGELRPAQAVDGLRTQYSLESASDIELLDDLQWADWDLQGRLLVATRPGELQIRRDRGHSWQVEVAEDLTALQPRPEPAPHWAGRWPD